MKAAFLTVALAALCTVTAAGQSVTIIPRKQIYHRPKPNEEYRKTFSIRRPIAKASTPELSRKITAAIDPVAVLDIRLRDELGREQWLDDADYKVLYNKNSILSIEESMEGTGAYTYSITKWVAVNSLTGNRIRPKDIFIDLPRLARTVKRKQDIEVREAIAEMKKELNLDEDPKTFFSETDFKVTDLAEFSVSDSGIIFQYDYGFSHALLAEEPAGEFRLSWKELSPFIRRDGLLAKFIR
jgi:hypothetical protein